MANLQELLELQNPHWEGERYPYPIERKELAKVKAYLSLPHIVMLKGPRRVGKTVMLKQVINHLIEKGVKEDHILYYSYDEAIVEPLEIIKTWEQRTGRKARGSLYVLLDEIQHLPQWGAKVKTLHDHLSLKLFLSGSSSLNLNKGRESLAGRMVEVEVGGLSYKDYLRFTGEEKGWHSYYRYLKRQLPQLALYPSLSPKEYVGQLIKKVVWEDAVKLHHIREPEVLESLLHIILAQPGQEIKVEDVAREFGISRPTASLYLHILVESMLVRKLYNFTGNVRKSEKKAKRYYPFFATLSTLREPPFPLVAETDVAEKLRATYFFRRENREIDFVVVRENRITLGVEVKTGKRVRRKELSTLLSKAQRAVVVVGEHTKVEADVERVELPHWEEWVEQNGEI